MNVHTDLFGCCLTGLPCSDELVSYVVRLCTVPVDCERHIVSAVDLNGLVLAVDALEVEVLNCELVSGELLVTDAALSCIVLSSVSIVDPACFLENFDSSVLVEGVLVKNDLVLNCLECRVALIVRTVNNRTVTAGEGLCELRTVDGVHDSLTNFDHTCGAVVSAEADLTVACTVVVSFSVLIGGLFYKSESCLSVSSAGDTCKDINLTSLEHIGLSLRNGLDVGDGFDRSLASCIVAGILGVELKGCDTGSIVVVLYYVRTGVRKIGIPLEVSGDNVSHSINLSAILFNLCVESIVKTYSLGSLVNNDLCIADVESERSGAEASVCHRVVVVSVISKVGYGEGIVVKELNAGEELGSGYVVNLCTVISTVVCLELSITNVVGTGSTCTACCNTYGRGVTEHTNDVVLSIDSRTVAEYKTFFDLDCVSKSAVLVYNLGGLFCKSGHIPDVSAVLISLNGAVTGGKVLNVEVGRSGRRLAPAGATECAGELSSAAEDYGVFSAFLDGSRNDCVSGCPVRSGCEVLDLCIVKIEVLVRVKRNFGCEVVPSLDVEFPPLVEDVLGSFILAAFRNCSVVNHCHGEEVHTELILLTFVGNVCKAVFFLYHIDSNVTTDHFINGRIVLVCNSVCGVYLLINNSTGSLFAVSCVGCLIVISILICTTCKSSNKEEHSHYER